MELLREEVKVESKGWMAERVVARSLGRRVSMEVVACEFRQWARLKGEVAAFNLEHGYLMFRFREARE